MSTGHAYDDNRSASTMYGPRPWTNLPRYTYTGPFATNEERLIQQAIAVITIPGQELQDNVRPPLPQIDLFPARYGYSQRALGISDIISVDRRSDARISWNSGGISSYSGTSRNSLGNGV